MKFIMISRLKNFPRVQNVVRVKYFFISLILFNSKTSLFLFNSAFLSWPIPCSALIAPPKILTLSKTILFIDLHIDFLINFVFSSIKTLKCKLLSLSSDQNLLFWNHLNIPLILFVVFLQTLKY